MSTRVLIVEDEPLIALDMEAVLSDAGFEIAEVAATVDCAMARLDQGYDLAILDTRVRGESIEPVANALRDRGTPFLFISGYGRVFLPDAFLDAPLVSKPFEAEGLVRAALRLVRNPRI